MEQRRSLIFSLQRRKQTPRHAVREPHFKANPIITTSAFPSRPNFFFRNNFRSSIWSSCNTPGMPSDKPPCPFCNSTDSFALLGPGAHLCKSCTGFWNSPPGPCPIVTRSSGHDGYGTWQSIEIHYPKVAATTASDLVDPLQITQTSPSDTERSALPTCTDAVPGLVFDKSSDQSLALQATAAGASGSAEIRSAEIPFDRNGPRVLLGTLGTAEEAAGAYDRAAYARRDAIAIRNFPNECPLGCKAASSERQAVENAVLLLNERAKADDSFHGLYFVCKACGKTFSTHQAWEVHWLSRPELTPTKPNVSVNATTNRVSSGELIGLAHQGSDDIENGRLPDRVRGRPKWEILVDPLFDVNVQGAFTLVTVKSSNGSSPAKDVLLYVLGSVYVLGFLSAVGGKLLRSFKMQLIGWVATALGFLLTMALLLA